MLALINHTHENTGLTKAKLHWSGFCTNTYTQMCRITRLGGSGGMLPQEKFDAVRQLLRLLLGLKHHLEVFTLVLAWQQNSLHGHTHGNCVHRHQRFQVHPWNREKKWRTKASQCFVTLDLILSNTQQECVLVLRSPQITFMLGPQSSSCGHKSVLAICMFLA